MINYSFNIRLRISFAVERKKTFLTSFSCDFLPLQIEPTTSIVWKKKTLWFSFENVDDEINIPFAKLLLLFLRCLC